MENKRKSRGSFVDVRRKSLTFNNIFNEENEEPLPNEKPRYSMKGYLESLHTENNDWKEILKQTKSKCKESKEKYEFERLTINSKDVEKYLTSEDKKFVENKPDYLAMAKSIRNYIDALEYLNKYKLDIIDSYNKACVEAEINTNLLVSDMCAGDLCEICNTRNCHNPVHKFNI